MSKKIIIAGILLTTLLNSGCNNFIAKKEDSQIINFKNIKVSQDIQTLTLYKLDYPTTNVEKNIFYNRLELLLSKMVAHKKDINLIIPIKLYQDLTNYNKNEVGEDEEIYKKYSYLLSDDDKKIIDQTVNVKTPKNVGSTQDYLNKQVAYWYRYLKTPEKYDENTFYTELDKNKLLTEVFTQKKELLKLIASTKNDFVIEVDNSDLELNIIKNITFPLYIKSNNIERDKLEQLKSKIFIFNGSVKDQVIPNKILLIQGRVVENLKNYKINTVVKSIVDPLSLLSILENNNGLKLKNMEDFSVRKATTLQLNKASVHQEKPEREKINFIDISTQWRTTK